MSTIVQYFEHSLSMPFFGIRMKTDFFQSCGHCWVFQIYKHSETKNTGIITLPQLSTEHTKGLNTPAVSPNQTKSPCGPFAHLGRFPGELLKP